MKDSDDQNGSPPFANGSSSLQATPNTNAQLKGWGPIETCNSPGNAMETVRPRRKKRKEEDFFTLLRCWMVEHQIGISINLILLLFLTHICFPRARRRTRSFFQLSYYVPSEGTYLQGPADLFFVTYWIVIFTGLRAGVMTYALLPLAGQAGIVTTKAKVRFAEQAWLLLYYIVFWTMGMYLMYNSPYWLNLHEMWTNFPTREMSLLMKWYYLVQFAFWLQQILVVHIEERRKDHWQMLTHHIVTCVLMFTSYGHYQTKVGNVILCAMDVVDLVFPAAKILKYSGYQTACDIAFGVFILSWFLARHVIYLTICWSLYIDAPVTIKFACFNSTTGAQVPTSISETAKSGANSILPNLLHAYYESGGTVCFNRHIHLTFISLLLFLQGITIMWFVMIMRVAWKVINGHPADDSRSDDEGEDEEEEEVEDADDDFFGEHDDDLNRGKLRLVETGPHTMQPLEVQHQYQEEVVGVEEVHLSKRRPQSISPSGSSARLRKGNKGSSSGSGLSIRGASEHKELLGRIGCDKPT